MTFGKTSSTMFYYTRVMKNLFKKAQVVAQVDELWEVKLLTTTYVHIHQRLGILRNYFFFTVFCPFLL